MIDSDEELEAYKDLIAGSSSDEYGSQEGSENGEEDEAKQKQIEAMRQKLLSGLDDSDFRKKRDLQGSSSDEDNSELKELKVQFGVGFNEDIGQKLL